MASDLMCYSCPFMCGFNADSLQLMSTHMRKEHHRHLHSIQCSQKGCYIPFSELRTFLTHLKKYHPLMKINESVASANATISRSCYMVEDNHLPSCELPATTSINSSDSNAKKNHDAFLVEQKFLELILQLRSKSGFNECNTIFIVTWLKEFLVDVKECVCVALSAELGSCLDEIIAVVCKTFSKTLNVLSAVDTIYKQNNFFSNILQMVQPVEIVLGQRLDKRYSKEKQKFCTVGVVETFQYVSIGQVLRKLFENTNLFDWLKALKPSKDGFLHSYIDGQVFANHALYSNNHQALQLYYDEVEVVNPLGSKTKIHEVGMFYYTIQNLPRKFNSSLSNIHLLAVANSVDVKKYGFHMILRPFIEELQQLESDQGLEIQPNVYVQGTVSMLVADTLAAHMMLGFQSPSATYFCRLCYAKRENTQHKFLESDFIMRSSHTHDVIVNSETLPHCGVLQQSPLSQSKFFRVTENFAFDPMHDLLEGVMPKELKLLLHYLVYVRKALSVAQVNNRLASFNYGSAEMKDKPSPNITESSLRNVSDGGLKQKAAQVCCLIRHFPLLFGDLFHNESPHLELILLLLQIMDIVFSSTVSYDQIAQLKDLIHQHHMLFKQLFPDVRMINKHHHMIHYATCIEKFGPMSYMSCMRYEAKHFVFKKYAQMLCNFKNICKSLATKHQIQQCLNFAFCPTFSSKPSISEGSFEKLEDLHFHIVVQQALGLDLSCEVFLPRHATVNNTVYKSKLCVSLSPLMENEGDLQMFGQILKLMMHENKLYLIVNAFCTELFSEHFHSFVVSSPSQDRLLCIAYDSLKDYHTYNLKAPYGYTGPHFFIVTKPS